MTQAAVTPTPRRSQRFLRLLLVALIATVGSLIASPPAQAVGTGGANFIATGHDMDYHCNYNDANECAYLKLVVDLVRKGSSLPVLAVDRGTMLTTALYNAGVTPVSKISPSNATAFNAVPFTDASGVPLYSAIVVGSGYYSVAQAEIPTINARSADFKTFFNGGGGILALSSVGFANFYNFVPISITGTSVSEPFTPTALGASYGITSAMANCCATHNSFATPSDPVKTLETDSTGASETIGAFDAKISDAGFSVAPNVVISGGAAVSTNITAPTISGTTDAPVGSSFSVTVGGQTLTGTVAAGATATTNTWTVTATTLAQGVYPVVASVTAAGKTGTANQSLTVDTTAPVIAFNLGAAALTREPTPTLRGTSGEPAGTPITVTVNGQTLNTTVESGGTWRATPSALPDGTYPVVASITDKAGNSSSATLTLTVDTRGPSLTIDDGYTLLTRDPVRPVSGTTDADEGTTVDVSFAGQTLTAVVGAGGTWSVTPAPVADGAYTITVSVSDPAGNVTTDTQARTVDTTPPALTFDKGPSWLTNSSTPTVTGRTRAPIGSTVTVSIEGQADVTATVEPVEGSSDNTWSVPLAALPDGETTVTATASDQAGNVATSTLALTIDTLAPVITVNGGRAVTVNTQTPTITGVTDAAPGSMLHAHIAEQHFEDIVVQPDGSWSVTVGTLDEGTPEFTISVTDPAGNVGTAAQLVTVDVSAPALAVDGPGTVLTGDETPTFTGTTDADPGSTVTFEYGKGVPPVTALVTAAGTWSVTLPTTPDGNYIGRVAVTDVAGNTGTATVLFEIDATAPAGTIDGGATVLTKLVAPTFSGTSDAPIGSEVAVQIGDRTETTTVTDYGTWSLLWPADLSDGTYQVGVRFTDPAGNVGTATQQLTVDTTAPTGTIKGGPAAWATSATPTVSGTIDTPAGSTVTVVIGGQTLTATVADDGTWSVVVPTALADGNYDVSVTFTDAAGNTSAPLLQVLSVDTVAPTGTIDGGPTLLLKGSPATVGGTATAGASVSVTVNGVTLTAVAGDDGKWSVTLPTTLADGTYDISASFTDAAGNSTSATQKLTVDSTPPSASFTNGASFTTTDRNPVISGISDAPVGSTVVVSVNGVDYTTTVQVLGAWQIAVAALPIGSYTVTVKITDEAGNTTTQVQQLTISSTPVTPTTPTTPTTPARPGKPTTTVTDLAYTGTDTQGVLESALALLVLGAGLTIVAGRRRTRTERDSNN